jgi:hypothetical protein
LRSLPKELRDKLWLYIVHSFDPIPQEVIKYEEILLANNFKNTL